MKKNRVHGTPEQFEAALKNKIQELGGSIQDDVTSAVEIDDDKERYIHTLIGDIQSELQSEVNSITFDTDDDSLIITVVYKDSAVREFHVPFSDLHYDFDEMDADVSYVINAVLYDLDTYDEEFNREYVDDVISESTKVQSSDDADYNDYVDYTQFIEPVKRKLASVGVDVNSPEADDYADAAAELIAQDDDHDVEYWWKETKSDPMYMDEVDALPHV